MEASVNKITATSGVKVALYSHDAQGLGHIRRNLNLAKIFASLSENISILLICGTRSISNFSIPPGIDTLILPSIQKVNNNGYVPKDLNVDLADLVRLRAAVIKSAIVEFNPDLFIADKHPFGFHGELEPALDYLSTTNTHLVLGLRDIIDDPVIAFSEWNKAKGPLAVEEFYDSIWIYGDQKVSEPALIYKFSEQTLAKTTYTGYLNPLDINNDHLSDQAIDYGFDYLRRKYVLCMLGGGQDGFELAYKFADSAFGRNRIGVIITGPYMDSEQRNLIKKKARGRIDLHVLEVVSSTIPLIENAEAVISLGGYNTICEVLSLRRRALIVPRVKPRVEQLIRATEMHRLGLLQYLHPSTVTTETLSQWLATDAIFDTPKTRLNFGGFRVIRDQVADLLGSRSSPVSPA